MKFKITIISLFILITVTTHAQNNFRAVVKDSAGHEPLVGATVSVEGTNIADITNDKGSVTLRKVPDGEQTIVIYAFAHKKTKITYTFPLDSKKTITIFLPETDTNLDEVVITTSRTNSRIEDSPTMVEVMGQEEMDEESAVVPGNISSLLGDLSIITVQHTSPINGNEAIRMQGLDSKYTQIMRDGMPLFGGFSGSLGVLSIPPLDLKQVEIIKGAASTLYGGGAIGGLINLISKTPGETPEATITASASSLGEGNLNAYTSGKLNKTGYTLFAGANVKQAQDINGDGFAEVPKNTNYTVHPRLFFEVNPKTKIILSFTSTYDSRTGGDIQAIDFGPDDAHPFIQTENTYRNTLDFSIVNKHSHKHTFSFKAAGSAYERDADYSGAIFNGIQYSSYSELNDVIKLKKHTMVLGLNFISENFVLVQNDSTRFGNYDNYTAGSFIQDDWNISSKLIMQMGMRYDYHFTFNSFYLPRVSFLYKPNRKISFRLAGGSGYKTPNMFDLAAPSRYLNPVGIEVKSENAYGANADIIYHTVLFEALNLQIDQAFYYAHITNPIVLQTDTTQNLFAANADYKTNSYGTDTYARLTYKQVEVYLGYNHTESRQKFDTTFINTPFNPKDKFSSVITYTVEEKWRFALEAAFTANQYIYNNDKVNDFWFMAAMIERKFKFGSIVLNCENLLNNKQSKYESLVEGTKQKPVFKPVWNSLEGRVINLSLKWTL